MHVKMSKDQYLWVGNGIKVHVMDRVESKLKNDQLASTGVAIPIDIVTGKRS